MLLRSKFSPFPQYFQYLFLIKGVYLQIHLLNLVVRFNIFLNSENLLCRSTDISKGFRGSLQVRDNESRLYLGRKVAEISHSPSNNGWKIAPLINLREDAIDGMITTYSTAVTNAASEILGRNVTERFRRP